MNSAADEGSDSGGGKAGDLAQQFFQRFMVIGGDIVGCDGWIRGDFGGGLRFAEECSGKTRARGGRQTEGHFAMNRTSSDHCEPGIGIGQSQRLGSSFECGRLSGGTSGSSSRNLGEHFLETCLPSFAPLRKLRARIAG